ncbi:MAG: hypothetical protein M5U19_17240 [Microthrixaceae bacterium]|nr:hypothetical protein [Microthrixaceae bacterium]
MPWARSYVRMLAFGVVSTILPAVASVACGNADPSPPVAAADQGAKKVTVAGTASLSGSVWRCVMASI